MILNDLTKKMENIGELVCLKHKDMRTVKFWPLSVTEGDTHYVMNGYWIALQTMTPIERETIKIKKEALQDWDIV